MARQPGVHLYDGGSGNIRPVHMADGHLLDELEYKGENIYLDRWDVLDELEYKSKNICLDREDVQANCSGPAARQQLQESHILEVFGGITEALAVSDLDAEMGFVLTGFSEISTAETFFATLPRKMTIDVFKDFQAELGEGEPEAEDEPGAAWPQICNSISQICNSNPRIRTSPILVSATQTGLRGQWRQKPLACRRAQNAWRTSWSGSQLVWKAKMPAQKIDALHSIGSCQKDTFGDVGGSSSGQPCWWKRNEHRIISVPRW